MENEAPSGFCNIVIPAPDLQKAKLVYERVFNWKVQQGVPGQRYWFFQSGNVGGAFNGRTSPARGTVVLVLRVHDIDVALAAIRDNGGTVTQEPSAIGEADPGRDAYFIDPNGNELGVYVGP